MDKGLMMNGRRKDMVKRGAQHIRTALFCALLLLGAVLPFAPAQACCTCLSVVQPVSYREWFTTGKTVDDITHTYDQSMTTHEGWIVETMFRRNILPAMQLMAEQLTTVMLQQVEILGALFDAKQQLETQRTFERLEADAHRDYHVSNGMCEFGTAVRSLASSARRGEFNSVALSQRSMDRNLGNGSVSAQQGSQYDRQTRLAQFRTVYCDPKDNNGLLKDLCPMPGPPERHNRDIDYSGVIDYPLTLKANFTDSELKRDEQDVFALAANLYGDEVFIRPPPEFLQLKPTDEELPAAIQDYMDSRAVVAKRALAENSYNAIVGMKTESPDSTVGSTKYLQELIKQLGVEKDADIQEMLGQHPSYYAQMEVLTKRIFENPLFYTNLYDKTANVARKDVALKAISLMQKFDTFKSSLRTEANLSMLLELSAMDTETGIMDNFNRTVTKGQIAPTGGGGAP
jgi:hypothetical protein